jgi:selenocysteine-specific elongation factor
VEHALAQARGLVGGSQPVAVSATTGEGLDELRSALASTANGVERDRARTAPTRLFVDRVFTLRGIGTIATGTLWSGSIGVADRLRVEPGGSDVRVRSVHVHDRAVRRAEAGQRVAAALAGIRRRRLRRGDVLVQPGAYPRSYRLDVVLEELEPLRANLRVCVHHGTSQIPARLVRAGKRFAQLRLASPVVAARGDRVVLRTNTTVGGGRVLDPLPSRHADSSRFELLERGELPTPHEEPALRAPPRPQAQPMDRARAHAAARLDEALAAAGLGGIRIEDRALVEHLEREGRAVVLGAGYAVSTEAYEAARRALLDEAECETGVTLARFRDRLGISRSPAQLLLERFDADRLTRRVGDERYLRRRAKT